MDLVPPIVTECVPRKSTHRRIGQSGHHKDPAWISCGNTFNQILNYFSKHLAHPSALHCPIATNA